MADGSPGTRFASARGVGTDGAGWKAEGMPGYGCDRVIVGRQAVHDRDGAVVGFELLTGLVDRPGDEDEVAGIHPEAVCASGDSSTDLVVGDRQVFYPAERSLLAGEVQPAAPPRRLVLEVGERFAADPDVIAGVRSLADRGFRIALTAFPWARPAPELLAAASIVKIDTSRVALDRMDATLDGLRRADLQFLADRVESPERRAELRAFDFDLFQGYGIGRLDDAESAPPREPGASPAALARMSSILLRDPRDFDEIEDMLRTEPGLTYQLIELASIGRMGETARRVTSLRQAMVLVGSWRIQTWMAMLLAHPRGERTDGAMTGALARARACEVLSRPLGQSVATVGFTAGMISAFEELTRVPREELMATLALSDELHDAAFGDVTPLGRIVTDVAERQEGSPQPRRLADRALADIDAALAGGYEWATRASAAIA